MRVCRLTLRLQFMRWRELCKQRLVPCVPAPLLRCIAAWQAGRRQSGGQTASQPLEHLRPGLTADHQQGAESASVDGLEEASQEQLPNGGALLYHGQDLLPLPAGMAQYRQDNGEEDAADVSGSADHWASLDCPATEQARTWSHQKAD